jgi:hypothetical protein
MKRLGLALSLLIAVASLPGAAWAMSGPGFQAGFHGGFHPGFHSHNVAFVGHQRPFFHSHFFVRPFVAPGFVAAPVVVAPARSPVFVTGFWQWTGWQWVWAPGP